MAQSILSGLRSDRIAFEPYPHVLVPDALEPAYYAELAEAYPSMERIAGPGPLASNEVFRLPACEVLADPAIPAIWRDFFAYHCSGGFLQEMIEFWRTAIEKEYPAIEAWFGKPLAELTAGVRRYRQGKAPENLPENMRADAMLDCQFVVNSPVTTPSSVRGPHLDKPYKLFAALLYFRHPDDRSEGGNLLLERLRARHHFDRRQHVSDRFVERFAEVPYGPNTLIAWLNTPRSVHAVTPRSTTSLPRRYVNFLTECYTMPTDGFFQLERTLSGRVYTSVKRAIRRRVLRVGSGEPAL
jgi:hypothetical protein